MQKAMRLASGVALAAVIGLIALLSGLASATEISFQPNATNGTDTRITQEAPDTNWGTGTSMSMLLKTNNNNYGLMNWNFSCESIPSEATINSVIMQVNVLQYTVPVVTIFPFNHTWDEYSITYNNCGAGACIGWYNSSWNILVLSGVDGTGFKNITLNNTWYEMECAKPLEQRYGFFISGGSGTDSTAWYTSNHATADWRPKLYVDYTSLPVDTCTPPASGNYAVDCSDNCVWDTNDEIPANVTMSGSGIVNLEAVWEFTGTNQYINVESGCEFAIHSGGSIGG